MAATRVVAPFAGMVVQVNGTEGQHVPHGATLFILSVMKMEHSVTAPFDCRLVKLNVKAEAKVAKGAILATIEPIKSTPMKKEENTQAAAKRLGTIQSHLNDSWHKEVEELRHRKELAKRLGGDEGLRRQREAGKLTVRERITQLLDPNSFVEVGSIAGKATYSEHDDSITSFLPANFVSGRGKIDGRPVMVGGDDFTVRGGHADGGIFRKQGYTEQLSRTYRIPMVRLIDGSSGGGSVATVLDMQATYVPPLFAFEHQVAMLSEVPVVSALLGPTVGLGAARAVTSHFSVMVRGLSQLFVAGPPVVEYATHEKLTKEELGGVGVCASNGSIDNVAESESEAFAQIRRFLSYLPSSAWEAPPRNTPNDRPDRKEEDLLSIIPKQRNMPYDIRRLISLVVDKDSFFEIGKGWGSTIVVGLARLDGYPVGIITSDCQVMSGVMSASGADKLRRHVDLCNTFHLPIVGLVDQPGFAVGLTAELEGTIRHGASTMAAMYQATVPWFSVIIRRVFGVAGAAWTDRGDPDVRVAWPSSEWGSLPLEGGIEAAFKRVFSASENPEKLREEMMARFDKVRSPFRTAELFGIEEIIDPRDTRPLLCDWIQLVYKTLELYPTRNSYRP